MNMGTGFGVAGVLSVVLLFLVKVLFVLFIVGLVVGVAITVKRIVFTEEDIQKIKDTLSGNRKESIREKCSSCTREQNTEWKVCPFCGTEAAANNV